MSYVTEPVSEYALDDRLKLESVGVEIADSWCVAIAELYRQVKFETISPDME